MKRFVTIFLTLALLAGLLAIPAARQTRHWTLRQKRRRRSQSPSCPIPGAADDWAVISVVRGGFDAPENWTDSYYRALAGKVLSTGGVLSKTRLTEYARVILGLTAIGEDPANVAGYHLLAALSDYDAATQPGVTSPPTCCWRSTAAIMKFRRRKQAKRRRRAKCMSILCSASSSPTAAGQSARKKPTPM